MKKFIEEFAATVRDVGSSSEITIPKFLTDNKRLVVGKTYLFRVYDISEKPKDEQSDVHTPVGHMKI